MFLSLRELELGPVRFSESVAPGAIAWTPNISQSGPLQATGQATLDPLTQEIRFSGHLAVGLQLECDRCLAPIAQAVDTAIDLAYEPLPEAAPGQELELHDADIDLGFYEGDGMELTDVLREQVLLDLPSRTLCSAECKGLCPVCGVNRNEQTCACTTRIPDERWAALRQL
jgi:uncharacterized protein